MSRLSAGAGQREGEDVRPRLRHARPWPPSSASTRYRTDRRRAAPVRRRMRSESGSGAVHAPSSAATRYAEFAAVTARRVGEYCRVPRSVSLPRRASARAQRRDQPRVAIGVQRHHRRRPIGPVPGGQHLHRGSHQVLRHLAVGFVEHRAAPVHPSQGRSAARSRGPAPGHRRSSRSARRPTWPARTATAYAV